MDQILINQADEYGFTAIISKEEKLIKCIQYENVSEIKKMLDAGINVNHKNTIGFTPLMYAARSGNLEITKLLLKYGAELEIKNHNKLTALDLAKFNGSRDVYSYLLEIGASEEHIKKMVLGDCKIEDDKKYDPLDIVKNSIYCENSVTGRENMNNMFKDIKLYADHRVEMIIACAALYTLEKKDKKFEIFVAEGENLVSLTGDPMDRYKVGGLYIERNILQMSNNKDHLEAARTLVHELTHKIHYTIQKKDKEFLLSCAEEFKNKTYRKKNSAGALWIKKEIIDRVENEGIYTKVDSRLEENVADIGNAIIYANSLVYQFKKNLVNNSKMNKKCEGESDLKIELRDAINNVKQKAFERVKDISKDILDAIEPLQKYFDEIVVPQISKYILEHPKFKNLQLSDEVKRELRKFKNKERNKNDTTLKINLRKDRPQGLEYNLG